MDDKKYDVWTYYTYNKPTDERVCIKIILVVLVLLGLLLIKIAMPMEPGKIKANLVLLGILLICIGGIFLFSFIGMPPKSNYEIIYAYVYSYDNATSKDMFYILNMWSKDFLSRTGLQAYEQRLLIGARANAIEINNEKRRKIVDTVRRYNFVEKLISEGRFEDIAMPIWRVTGIKETRHSVRVYYSYFSKQKQINTSLLIRDNVENFDTLVKCLREYVRKITTCCSWCGCTKVKGKCVVCGDTNGIKVPRKKDYYLKTIGLFLMGVMSLLILINIEIDVPIISAVLAMLSLFGLSYSIDNLIEMKKSVE